MEHRLDGQAGQPPLIPSVHRVIRSSSACLRTSTSSAGRSSTGSASTTRSAPASARRVSSTSSRTMRRTCVACGPSCTSRSGMRRRSR
ncbi:hypothetical protein VTN02DRAFT_3165 [Thermoascus thermophilus]